METNSVVIKTSNQKYTIEKNSQAAYNYRKSSINLSKKLLLTYDLKDNTIRLKLDIAGSNAIEGGGFVNGTRAFNLASKIVTESVEYQPTWTRKTFRKWVHNLVCLLVTGKKEEENVSFEGIIKHPLNIKRTPDFIKIEKRTVEITEVKTSIRSIDNFEQSPGEVYCFMLGDDILSSIPIKTKIAINHFTAFKDCYQYKRPITKEVEVVLLSLMRLANKSYEFSSVEDEDPEDRLYEILNFRDDVPYDDDRDDELIITKEFIKECAEYSGKLEDKLFLEKEKNRLYSFVLKETGKHVKDRERINLDHDKFIESYKKMVNENSINDEGKLITRVPMLRRKKKMDLIGGPQCSEERFNNVKNNKKEYNPLIDDIEELRLLKLLYLKSEGYMKEFLDNIISGMVYADFVLKPQEIPDVVNKSTKIMNISDEGQSTTICDDSEDTAKYVSEFKNRNRRSTASYGKFTMELKKELLRKGYSPKKAREGYLKAEHEKSKEDQEKTLSWDTNTASLENFLDSSEWFQKAEFITTGPEEELLNDASIFSHGRYETLEHEKVVRESQIYQSCDILRKIMAELAIAFKQYTKEDKWVVKMVPKERIMVIVKSYAVDKPLFCTVLWDPSYYEPLHRIFGAEASDSCSKFFTMTQDTVADMISACSSIMPNARVLFEHEDLPSTKFVEYWISNKCFHRHFNFLMCTKLESKKMTSTALFNIRYMYVHVAKDNGDEPTPFLVLSKFPTGIRSPLLLLTMRRVIMYFTAMCKTWPKSIISKILKDEEEAAQDKFIGLLSFIDGSEIGSLEKMITLSYLGSTQTKKAGESALAERQIMDKTVKEELIYLKQREEIRNEYKDFMNKFGVVHRSKTKYGSIKEEFFRCADHQFDPKVVLIAAKVGRDSISPDKKEAQKKIRDSILKFFEEDTVSQLSSNKSSSVDLKRDIFEMGVKTIKRVKVIENAMEMLCKGQKMDDLVQLNWDLMEKDGSIYITLFKKEQHGPTREILVMTLPARAQQLHIEKVSRAIDTLLKNECLTAGEQKFEFIKKHHKDIKEVGGKLKKFRVLNSNDIIDCTTWCQKFIMPLFGCLLVGYLGADISGLVSILNNFGRKKIAIPYNVLKDFYSKPNVNSFMEPLNVLKNYLLGREVMADFAIKGGNYFINKTNMGQGVLHYTSSLLAASMDLLHRDKMERIARVLIDKSIEKENEATLKAIKKMNLDERDQKSMIFENYITSDKIILIMNGGVSSDDRLLLKSMMIWYGRSIPYTNGFLRDLEEILRLISNSQFVLLELADIEISESKSTMNVKPFSEFNQSYSTDNTVIPMTIKFANVAVGIPSSCGFLEMQNEMSNHLKSLVSSGMSFQSVYLIQREMGRLYYRLNGSESKGWSEIKDMLKEIKMPQFGYFLLQPEPICGLLGLDFAYFNLLKQRPDLVKYVKAFKEKATLENSLTYNPDNLQFDINLSFRMGDSRMYKKFFTRMNQIMYKAGFDLDNLSEFINSNELPFKKKLEDIREQISFVYLKARSRGMEANFRRSSKVALMGASVYKSLYPVILLSERTEIGEMLTKENALQLLKTVNVSRTIKNVSKESNFKGKTFIFHQKKCTMKFILTEMYSNYKDLALEADEVERLIEKQFWPETFNTYTSCYIALNNMDFNVRQEKYYRKAKMIHTKVVRKVETINSAQLLNVCRWKWWNSANIIDNLFPEIWEIYKSALPFLRDTIEETIKQGKFRDAYEVRDMINRADPKSSSLKILGHLSRYSDDFSFFTACMRMNYQHNIKFTSELSSAKLENKAFRTRRLNELKEVEVDLNAIQSAPLFAPVKRYLFYRCMERIPERYNREHGYNIRWSLMRCIMTQNQKLFKNNLLDQSSEDYLLYYKSEKKENKFGKSTAFCSCGGNKFIIESNGTNVNTIIVIVTNKSKMIYSWPSLKNLLIKNNLNTIRGNSIANSSNPLEFMRMQTDDDKLLMDLDIRSMKIDMNEYSILALKDNVKLFGITLKEKFNKNNISTALRKIITLEDGSYKSWFDYLKEEKMEQLTNYKSSLEEVEKNQKLYGHHVKNLMKDYFDNGIIEPDHILKIINLSENEDASLKLFIADFYSWLTKSLSYYDDEIKEFKYETKTSTYNVTHYKKKKKYNEVKVVKSHYQVWEKRSVYDSTFIDDKESRNKAEELSRNNFKGVLYKTMSNDVKGFLSEQMDKIEEINVEELYSEVWKKNFRDSLEEEFLLDMTLSDVDISEEDRSDFEYFYNTLNITGGFKNLQFKLCRDLVRINMNTSIFKLALLKRWSQLPSYRQKMLNKRSIVEALYDARVNGYYVEGVFIRDDDLEEEMKEENNKLLIRDEIMERVMKIQLELAENREHIEKLDQINIKSFDEVKSEVIEDLVKKIENSESIIQIRSDHIIHNDKESNDDEDEDEGEEEEEDDGSEDGEDYNYVLDLEDIDDLLNSDINLNFTEKDFEIDYDEVDLDMMADLNQLMIKSYRESNSTSITRIRAVEKFYYSELQNIKKMLLDPNIVLKKKITIMRLYGVRPSSLDLDSGDDIIDDDKYEEYKYETYEEDKNEGTDWTENKKKDIIEKYNNLRSLTIMDDDESNTLYLEEISKMELEELSKLNEEDEEIPPDIKWGDMPLDDMEESIY